MTKTHGDRLSADTPDANSLQPANPPAPQALADPAMQAIVRWKQAMRIRVADYFQSLRALGVAPVHEHRIKGRSFIDLSIEGMRFKGQVRKGPVICAQDGDCPLSSASIARAPDVLHPARRHQWAICNYRTQRRILLAHLSIEGIRALACEFGLVIHGEGDSEMLSESECFVSSPAHVELQLWVQRYPALAAKLLRDFPEFLCAIKSGGEPKRHSRYRSLREFEYFTGAANTTLRIAAEPRPLAKYKGKP